jgi:hypothetical protein
MFTCLVTLSAVLPTPWLYATIGAPTSLDRSRAFERVYAEGRWRGGADGALCSSGWSKVEAGQGASALRAVLRVVSMFDIHSIADVPCGDGCFSGVLLGALHNSTSGRRFEYVGVDIVTSLIEKNRAVYEDGSTHFINADVIASATLPHAELIFSRQMLQHLCNEDALRFLRLVARSNAHYALLTTFETSDAFVNADIPCASGDFRPQDLTKPPYSLPPPMMLFSEHYPLDPRTALGLWSVRALRRRLL